MKPSFSVHVNHILVHLRVATTNRLVYVGKWNKSETKGWPRIIASDVMQAAKYKVFNYMDVSMQSKIEASTRMQ